ncbi:MAG: hypothetical protein EA360_08205 [Balneolaceae bacterium]|nr:MAG: hypothetical protein EA360_08205 [Balneolaceae bacterium]
MSTPKIAGLKPIKIETEKGKDFYWCSCGLSQNQPYCDGSHSVTDLTPLCVTPEESGRAFLCTCKQTKNPPYCDGTHSQFRDK